MQKIIISRPIVEDQLGLPRFTGKKMVRVEQRFKPPVWRVVEFVDGEATLPRGYRAVEVAGQVEMRDL